MESALLEIKWSNTEQPLLRMDAEAFAEKVKATADREERLRFREQVPQPPSSAPKARRKATVTYEDTLLFIAVAQEECHRLFGQLTDSRASGKAGVFDDGDNDGVDNGSDGVGIDAGESTRVSEWSQEEEPKRKKAKRR